MDQLAPLLVNIIGGAIGGGAAGKAPAVNLGPAVNAAAGAVGGGLLGQILQAAVPMLQNGSLTDIGAMAGNLVGGGVSGAIVSAIIGAIVNRLRPPAT